MLTAQNLSLIGTAKVEGEKQKLAEKVRELETQIDLWRSKAEKVEMGIRQVLEQSCQIKQNGADHTKCNQQITAIKQELKSSWGIIAVVHREVMQSFNRNTLESCPPPYSLDPPASVCPVITDHKTPPPPVSLTPLVSDVLPSAPPVTDGNAPIAPVVTYTTQIYDASNTMTGTHS